MLFLLLCFVYMVIFEIIHNRRAEGKPDEVTKLESRFYLFLDWLNRALNNPAQELRF